MKKVIVFGANGGLGAHLVEEFKSNEFSVFPITRNEIDFCDYNSYIKIINLLTEIDPDVIINASGAFGGNNVDFNKVFSVNVRSNWCIANYYMKHEKLDKAVKIIFIGSTSYSKGKKDYILYSSSKSALFNLYEGVSAFFADTNIVFGLVNPTRMDTKMLNGLQLNANYKPLDPQYVAQIIFDFTQRLKKSDFVNILN